MLSARVVSAPSVSSAAVSPAGPPSESGSVGGATSIVSGGGPSVSISTPPNALACASRARHWNDRVRVDGLLPRGDGMVAASSAASRGDSAATGFPK